MAVCLRYAWALYILFAFLSSSPILEPGKLYEELKQKPPPFCEPYDMGGGVTPFGSTSMPEKWPGSSSTYGRRVKTVCRAESPQQVYWGRQQLHVDLYSTHYRFEQCLNESNEAEPLSRFPQPSNVVKSKSLAGYNIVLLQMNGVFEDEATKKKNSASAQCPHYDKIGNWYPKTWGLLIYDKKGEVVARYRHITPEMEYVANQGNAGMTLQGNLNKALEIQFEVRGAERIGKGDPPITRFPDFSIQRGGRRRLLGPDNGLFAMQQSLTAPFKRGLCILISNLVKSAVTSTSQTFSADEIFDEQSDLVMDPTREVYAGIQFRKVFVDEDSKQMRLQIYAYPLNNAVATWIRNTFRNAFFQQLLSVAIQLTMTITRKDDPLYPVRKWSNLNFVTQVVDISDIPPAKEPLTAAPTLLPTAYPSTPPTPSPVDPPPTPEPTQHPLIGVDADGGKLQKCKDNEQSLLFVLFQMAPIEENPTQTFTKADLQSTDTWKTLTTGSALKTVLTSFGSMPVVVPETIPGAGNEEPLQDGNEQWRISYYIQNANARTEVFIYAELKFTSIDGRDEYHAAVERSEISMMIESQLCENDPNWSTFKTELSKAMEKQKNADMAYLIVELPSEDELDYCTPPKSLPEYKVDWDPKEYEVTVFSNEARCWPNTEFVSITGQFTFDVNTLNAGGNNAQWLNETRYQSVIRDEAMEAMFTCFGTGLKWSAPSPAIEKKEDMVLQLWSLSKQAIEYEEDADDEFAVQLTEEEKQKVAQFEPNRIITFTLDIQFMQEISAREARRWPVLQHIKTCVLKTMGTSLSFTEGVFLTLSVLPVGALGNTS